MSRCHVALVPGSHLMSQCHIFQLKWGELWQLTQASRALLSISDIAPVLYQSPDTGDPSRDQGKGEGEKETQSIVKYGLPRLLRTLATYLQLAEDWLGTIEILDTCLVTCHVSAAGAKFGLNIPRPLTRQPSIPGEMPAPYEEWTIDPSSLRTNDWSVPPRLWIIFRMQVGGVVSGRVSLDGNLVGWGILIWYTLSASQFASSILLWFKSSIGMVSSSILRASAPWSPHLIRVTSSKTICWVQFHFPSFPLGKFPKLKSFWI